ncbi:MULTISPECIES: hypothetical protein [Nocardia]|uniref:hypothetical protein n=1 Tax=Nocardia TaxID=1817 RepID=UPI00292F4626|nr:hypothetical protein [Nocardia canadensis]
MPENATSIERRRIGGLGETVSERPSLSSWHLTRAQLLWAALGLAVVFAILIMARGSVREIFKVQPDFVLGLSLSISTIFFTKAFSRSGIASAVHHIHEPRDPNVLAALDSAVDQRLHAMGLHENVALLSRDIAVASKRINEFYDLQAMEPRFHTTAPLLRVALTDLDDALAIVSRVADRIGTTETTRVYRIPEATRSHLNDALRDVMEASARRNETYEALRAQVAGEPVDDLWGLFAVLTSDTLKAQRDLESLVSKTIQSVPADRIAVLQGYVAASLSRLESVGDLIRARGLTTPPALQIIAEDLRRAQAKLTRAQEAEGDQHATPAAPVA